ncbi:MAG: response regulator [Reichenbachiella sp.]|uniref:response regulator n=1 Tax=Reichenbachiella sp. TaxID=2184521 RepID=UPI00326497FA
MKRILVIENIASLLDNISEILEMENYYVLKACHATEGYELACRDNPDVIISAINIGEMNGTELFKVLRANRKTRNIPFIFITTCVQKREVEYGLSLKPYAYIAKPFSYETLLSVTANAVRKRRKQRGDFYREFDGIHSMIQCVATSLI